MKLDSVCVAKCLLHCIKIICQVHDTTNYMFYEGGRKLLKTRSQVYCASNVKTLSSKVIYFCEKKNVGHRFEASVGQEEISIQQHFVSFVCHDRTSVNPSCFWNTGKSLPDIKPCSSHSRDIFIHAIFSVIQNLCRC